MSQFINIVKIDENGHVLAKCDVNFAELQVEFREIPQYVSHHPMLFGIDEYGDTYFNRLQVPLLTSELERLTASHPKLRDQISELVAFARSVGVHEYLKFIGD